MTATSILIADDDRELCCELSDMLRDRGYTVKCVDSGESALAVISDNLPDILLLDLKMPGIGGAETFRKLKKTYPDLPVIIMTAVLSSEVAKELPDRGPAPIVYKPFGIKEMAETIEKVLGRGQ